MLSEINMVLNLAMMAMAMAAMVEAGNCNVDAHCPQDEYCYPQTKECVPCFKCFKYKMHPKQSVICGKWKEDCGDCFEGYIKDGDYCSLLPQPQKPIPPQLATSQNPYLIGIIVSVVIIGLIIGASTNPVKRIWKRYCHNCPGISNSSSIVEMGTPFIPSDSRPEPLSKEFQNVQPGNQFFENPYFGKNCEDEPFNPLIRNLPRPSHYETSIHYHEELPVTSKVFDYGLYPSAPPEDDNQGQQNENLAPENEGQGQGNENLVPDVEIQIQHPQPDGGGGGGGSVNDPSVNEQVSPRDQPSPVPSQSQNATTNTNNAPMTEPRPSQSQSQNVPTTSRAGTSRPHPDGQSSESRQPVKRPRRHTLGSPIGETSYTNLSQTRRFENMTQGVARPNHLAIPATASGSGYFTTGTGETFPLRMLVHVDRLDIHVSNGGAQGVQKDPESPSPSHQNLRIDDSCPDLNRLLARNRPFETATLERDDDEEAGDSIPEVPDFDDMDLDGMHDG